MNTHRARPRGITLAEAIFSGAILSITIIGLFQTLNFGYGVAVKAAEETTCEARCVRQLEDMDALSYEEVTQARFPPQCVVNTQGTETVVVWAMTTTVVEVMSPAMHKRININATWRKGAQQRSARYVFLKAP
ncbi:hypothetical protein GX586_06830 [bacterium]|nr:hypothetical protein [bacterium]